MEIGFEPNTAQADLTWTSHLRILSLVGYVSAAFLLMVGQNTSKEATADRDVASTFPRLDAKGPAMLQFVTFGG